MQNLLPFHVKPFHMTEPVFEDDLWCLWIYADSQILSYVQELECIIKAPHYRQLPGLPPEKRIKVAINPRYDYQEVWLWLWDILELETKHTTLSEQWENALSQAM